jgi:hypothetical protein
MNTELIHLLGQNDDASAVTDIVRAMSLNEVDGFYDRRYVGSKASGIDLIVERGRVTTVQLYVEPAQGFLGYAGVLPFGIKKGMTQTQIFCLLGSPARSDESYSAHFIDAGITKLVVDYDNASRISLLTMMEVL